MFALCKVVHEDHWPGSLCSCKAWLTVIDSVERQKLVLLSGLHLFSEDCSNVRHRYAVWPEPGHGVQTWHCIGCLVLPTWVMKSIIHIGFSHMYLERCSWYYLYFPWQVHQSEQSRSLFVPFWWESITLFWTFCFSSVPSWRQWSTVVTGGQEVTRRSWSVSCGGALAVPTSEKLKLVDSE